MKKQQSISGTAPMLPLSHQTYFSSGVASETKNQPQNALSKRLMEELVEKYFKYTKQNQNEENMVDEWDSGINVPRSIHHRNELTSFKKEIIFDSFLPKKKTTKGFYASLMKRNNQEASFENHTTEDCAKVILKKSEPPEKKIECPTTSGIKKHSRPLNPPMRRVRLVSTKLAVRNGFIKDMKKYGLHEDIMNIDSLNSYISDELGKSPVYNQRNSGLDCPSGSTNNSQGAEGEPSPKGALNESISKPAGMTFPFQRRNRSISPPRQEQGLPQRTRSPKFFNALSLSQSESQRAQPIVAKNFMIGSFYHAKHVKSIEQKNNVMTTLAEIQKNSLQGLQDGSEQKEYIVDSFDDMPSFTIKKLPYRSNSTNVSFKLDKNIYDSEDASNKSSGKARHRRSASQVIDKNALKKILSTPFS